MTPLARYRPLGARPHYFVQDGSDHGPTISGLLARMPRREWDSDGVRAYLSRSPDGSRTCFRGVRAVGPGMVLVRDGDEVRLRREPAFDGPRLPLSTALERSVAGLAADGRRAAVALSGGLDSALLVALLRAAGRDDIPVVTLATHLDGHCELRETRAVAKKLGVHDLQEIEAGSLVAALPDAIAAAEAPLFNLHPVSRWLLARALRRAGFEVLLTGDGADQLFSGSDPRNYLPLVGAMTRAAGLELRSPFFDPRVAASAPAPTPDKSALRVAAARWLPPDIANRRKSPRFAPPLDPSDHWHPAAISSLAAQIGVPAPQPGTDAAATLWTTLGLLSELLD